MRAAKTVIEQLACNVVTGQCDNQLVICNHPTSRGGPGIAGEILGTAVTSQP